MVGAVAHFLPFLEAGAPASVCVEDGSAGVFSVLATPLISTTPRSAFAHMAMRLLVVVKSDSLSLPLEMSQTTSLVVLRLTLGMKAAAMREAVS